MQPDAGHTLLPGYATGREESCPVRQPGVGELPGTTRRVESCPVRQLGMSLTNNTIIINMSKFINYTALKVATGEIEPQPGA